MKNVLLTPNPYRDRNFTTVRSAIQILREAGMRPSVCLPFEVDRNFELPKDIRSGNCQTPMWWFASAATVRFCIWPRRPPNGGSPFWV